MIKRFVTWLYHKVVGHKERTVVRLSADQLQALAKQLPNTAVSDSTNVLNAGYKLGVQHVLAKLQEGFVDGRA